MGHYDLSRDTDGPNEYELRQRRKAYKTKKRAESREKISDEDVRAYLAELNQCHEADGLTCSGSSYCQEKDHAKNALHDESIFEAARRLVTGGAASSVYDTIETDTVVEELVTMCRDGGLTSMGLRGQRLTDEGHQVMLGDDFDRPELHWDDEKAQKYRKHD